MALLKVDDVYAGYGETEILHGVSLRIEPSEMVAVIGPNGAGKSTLAKTIIGILKPSKGSIRFQDFEIIGWPPQELVGEGLAYVPQNRNIFPSLTVRENLEMGAITRRPGLLHRLGASVAGLARGDSRYRTVSRQGGPSLGPRVEPLTADGFEERVERILEVFPNLRPKLKVRAGSLSGGEQQMVAMGKALVLDPVLLLLDEPSAGLAPKLVNLIFDKVREINARGAAVLLVEQNAKRALAMAHRGYVFEMGRNKYEGKGEALLLDPEVGRLYLGG